jgi:hypothetical protein
MWVVRLALKQPHSVGVHATSTFLLAYASIAWAASHLLWGHQPYRKQLEMAPSLNFLVVT